MDEEARFRQAVEFVLAHEGGLSEDPDDPGGVTKYGISARSYLQLGPDGIRRLTREDAIAIYRRDWWDRYGYAKLPDPIATKVFDLSVNMGAGAAHRRLQEALRACGYPVAVDGVIGPQTLSAAQKADPKRLMSELMAAAALYYVELVLDDPKRRKYLRGWLRRACALP